MDANSFVLGDYHIASNSECGGILARFVGLGDDLAQLLGGNSVNFFLSAKAQEECGLDLYSLFEFLFNAFEKISYFAGGVICRLIVDFSSLICISLLAPIMPEFIPVKILGWFVCLCLIGA
ncbi:hypothetical protein L1D29_00750 [Shewanella insulae]|uniref:hypothetical protein n=1 Tax=Shewanella insulae TaxID=2681496 RepID=UPI001EFC8CA3|nr:hypothetical protein [Shewanella insulae]MCG9711346.1 hypothetical protein [Shewanella insulae]